MTNLIAAESFNFWRPKVPLVQHAWAWMAMEDGETSFNPKAIGDKDQARGSFQWHQARRDEILKGCGLDVWHGSHLDMLNGAYWEATKGWYKNVWPALIASTLTLDAVTILVREFEQSANPGLDIARRFLMAEKWALVYPK